MDLNLIRGDTYTLTFNILTADGSIYALQDGDKLYFTVKKSFNHGECVLQKTFGNGITRNEQTGEYEIRLDNLCTCELDCGAYVYDIKVILANNGERVVNTLIKGALVLDNNATHRGNE